MSTTPISGVREYVIRIDYLTGGEIFAVEDFRLSIAEGEDINTIAAKLAIESPYCNEQVPDFNCSIAVYSVNPEGPDNTPPPKLPIMPKCPNCGDTDITHEGKARWDAANQRWYLASIGENETCENCGTEGKELAIWVVLEHASRVDFLQAVAAKLDDLTLPDDPVFQLVIGDVHGKMTVDEAVREWTLASGTGE